MAKEFAKAFYNSTKWKKCRNGYIAERVMIDGGMCEECGKELGYIVHHTVTLTPENINNSEVSLNWEHLKYVGKKCHDEYEGHGIGQKTETGICIFDKQGQVVGVLRHSSTPPY